MEDHMGPDRENQPKQSSLRSDPRLYQIGSLSVLLLYGLLFLRLNVSIWQTIVTLAAAHFPEDLMFQETTDRSNFQTRYILRHPWNGTDECPAAAAYRQQLRERYEKEAQTLANLTGWQIGEIRRAMNLASTPLTEEKRWYQRLWSN
jgi:hypothetical protein